MLLRVISVASLLALAGTHHVGPSHRPPKDAGTLVAASGGNGYQLLRLEAPAAEAGRFDCVLRRRQMTAWEHSFARPLEDVKVSLEGTTCAIQYETDTLGSPSQVSGDGKINIFVHLIDDTGKTWTDARKRGSPGYGGTPVSPARPYVERTTMIDWSHRFVVHAHSNRGSGIEWWIYDTATRKHVRDVVPPGPMVKFPMLNEASVDPIPGTPLILVHYWWVDLSKDDDRLRTASYVIDSDGEKVWSRSFSNEYKKAAGSRMWPYIEAEIEREATVTPGGFRLCIGPERLALTYTVSQTMKDGKAIWSVNERP